MAPDLKVVAIVPAFNEESRVTNVLNTLVSSKIFSRVLVVDDGSMDKTSKVAQNAGAEVYRLEVNQGKGAALQKGLDLTPEADVYFFIDADLVGLKEEHLKKMLKPLLEDEELVMTVGIFKGGRLRTDLAQVVAPQISGQRAFKKIFLNQLPDLSKSGFGCEVIINYHLENHGFKYLEVDLEGVTQVMKEEKIGYFKGPLYRAKMYWDLLSQWLKRRFLLV